jgi:hypothetical protein
MPTIWLPSRTLEELPPGWTQRARSFKHASASELEHDFSGAPHAIFRDFGFETGSIASRLWNELKCISLPIVRTLDI